MSSMKIALNENRNIGKVVLKANTTILEIITLKEVNYKNPVKFENLKDLLSSEDVVFKFYLDKEEIDALSKHYDKYHTDNIAVEFLKEIKQFTIYNYDCI